MAQAAKPCTAHAGPGRPRALDACVQQGIAVQAAGGAGANSLTPLIEITLAALDIPS